MAASQFVVEGVTVNCRDLQASAAQILEDCGRGKSFGVFTLNLDHIVKLRRDAKFRAAYCNARYITADGFPVVWAGRLSGAKVDRVTGADMILPLCAAAAHAGQPIYLFGSQTEALGGAAQFLTARLPGLTIGGMAAPALGFDPASEQAASYARQIAASGAKICFVALGAPKQELFAALACQETTGIAFVCIGAGLDFLAGMQVRAPRIMQASGMEWIWRLLSNPRRLGRRYLDCLLVLPTVLLQSYKSQRCAPKASVPR
jgi:exopolysaccharide biosynthesis WecB/TagA/CpsF family protein